jgi:hypothetical protein
LDELVAVCRDGGNAGGVVGESTELLQNG